MATVQTRAVIEALGRLGHATNAELLAAVGEPLGLSLPSLHRITARLAERGVIGLVVVGGREMVFDARPEVHHHFSCTQCGGLLDVELPPAALEAIQHQLGAHLADDGLVVRGRCAQCVLARPEPVRHHPRRATQSLHRPSPGRDHHTHR